MKTTTAILSMFAFSSAAIQAITLDCGADSCLTPLTLQCKEISSADCTDLCYWPDPTNPQYCTDNDYSLVKNSAVRGNSLACNDDSTRLYYTTLDDCMNMCDSCVGCVGFVDNRERAKPYCVFKDSESTLYGKNSKDFYRGGYFMIRHAAISGSSIKCDGSTKLFTTDLQECAHTCNSCDGCVGYVYNREKARPYCVFKEEETNIYTREDQDKDYYRQDTTLIKRFPMNALAIAIKDEYDTLMAEDPEAEPIRFEDVVELSYQLLRGETFIEDADMEASDAKLTDDLAKGTGNDKECIEAIIKVAVDAFAAAFAVVGLGAREANMASRALISGLDAAAITGFEALVIDISNAESTWDQAMATFSLISAIKTQTGSSQVLKALQHTIKPIDYVIMSVTVAAQFVALTTSDGTAMVAEFVLLGTVITQELVDAVAADRICGK